MTRFVNDMMLEGKKSTALVHGHEYLPSDRFPVALVSLVAVAASEGHKAQADGKRKQRMTMCHQALLRCWFESAHESRALVADSLAM